MSAKKRSSRGERIVGYIVAIIVNAAMWYVAQNVLRWDWPFITVSFARVLPALRLSLTVSIIGNVIFMVFDARWFKAIVEAVMNAVAIYAAYTLFRVFPFEFRTSFFDWAVKLALIGGMVGLAIATVVGLVTGFLTKE
jgi:hypothetical protein